MNQKIIAFLAELLKDNKRVILPGLGAFLIKNEDKNILTFNEYMKFNDRLFANALSKQENISEDEALKQITEVIDQIKDELKAGKTFSFPELGTLKQNEIGKLVFEQNVSDAKEENKEQDLPEVDKNKEEAKTENPVPEPKEETKAVDNSENKEEETEAKEETNDSNKSIETGATIDLSNNIENKKATAYSHTSSSSNLAYKKKVKFGTPEKNNAKTIVQILIGLLFVVLIVSAVLIIRNHVAKNKNEKIVLVPKSETEENSQEDDKTEANSNTEAMESSEPTDAPKQSAEEKEITEDIVKDLETNNATQKTIVKPETANGNGHYYIIAGCFSVENNADNLTAQLQKEGYNASRIGKINNLFAVSYASFEDRKEAVNYLKSLIQDKQMEGWIYKK